MGSSIRSKWLPDGGDLSLCVVIVVESIFFLPNRADLKPNWRTCVCYLLSQLSSGASISDLPIRDRGLLSRFPP